MTPQIKAFFEPENLNNASPATVSRAGIIYVSDTELGWQPVVSSWLQVRLQAVTDAGIPIHGVFLLGCFAAEVSAARAAAGCPVMSAKKAFCFC